MKAQQARSVESSESSRVPFREFAILFAWAVGVSCLVLAAAALGDGWPQNHEGVAAVHRMMAVVGQWEAGNLMPVWSSVLHQGMGSPMPGLYHKSFMFVSSAIYALTGGVKIAVVGALLGFSVLAFMGVGTAAVAAFGREYWPTGVLAGALLLTSNYATTDWLVRGAFAEYSAVAAIAALMVPLIRLVRLGVWSRWMGPGMALLMVSHMALALFVPFLFAVALMVAARVHALDWRVLLRQMGSSGLVAVALSFPFLMPVVAFSGYNDTTELLSEGLRPGNNFIDPINYVWDRAWTWGDTWEGFTVQFDLYVFPLVLGVLALVLMRAGGARQTARGEPQEPRGTVDERGFSAIVLFLLGGFALYLLLQMRIAAPLYETMPGARYLQFPWRLQAYTTVTSVLLMSAVVVGLWRQRSVAARWGALMLSLLSIFVSLNSSLAVSGLRYSTIADMRVHGPGETDYLAGGEFGPRPPPGTELPRYAHLAAQFAQASAGQCSVEGVDRDRFVEASELKFQVTCRQPGDARFPIFVAPGMSVRLDDGTPTALYRTCTDARARLDLPAGSFLVVIGTPSWWSLLISRLKGEPTRTRDYC